MSVPDEFVDFYELLQVSPNAENETIQRVFRLLAQRLHPDNKETGNEKVFQGTLRAYQTLSDPVQRAAYDAQHRAQVKLTWQIFDQGSEPQSRESQTRIREGILGVLYKKRQHSPGQPGMNIREMEDLLGIPREHLEFSLWYLKEKVFIKVGDNGRYVITAQGVEIYEGLSAPEFNRSGDLYMLPAARSEAV
ncbi:MAG TPA: DnaJ domain-containing protein [Bryobacteraceae bacterium]|nr:DnaJ domain-containing protein [Bryobacteraceae bacterium]